MGESRFGAGRVLGLAVVILLALGAVVGFTSSDTQRDKSVQAVTEKGDANMSSSQWRAGAENQGALPSTTIPAAPFVGAGSGGAVAADTAAPPAAQVATGVDQRIVKDATVRVEVGKGKFRQAFDAASRAAASHGGFVVSSESSSEKDQGANGEIVFRVPVAAFDALRADLAKLGEVKDERISGQDVSGQLVDLDARIRSLVAQEDSLRVLMAKAKTIGETVEVQNHLTQVRQQIEQLSGQKALLENKAALSTVRLELAEPGAVVVEEPKGEPSAVRQAVTRAVDGAETVVAGTIVVLGWAIPLAILAALAWLAIRPFRHRAPLAGLTEDRP